MLLWITLTKDSLNLIMKIKKLLAILVLGLLLCNIGLADSIKELNKKLLKIEKRIDTCLTTKDKDICVKFVLENPFMLEILENDDFVELLSSGKCEIRNKCGATQARLLAKMFQVEDLLMDMD